MTELYDGSFRDVAKRLRDDDLVSLKLVNDAADMIEKFGKALEGIMQFGYRHSGHGYSCAKLAETALEVNSVQTKEKG